MKAFRERRTSIAEFQGELEVYEDGLKILDAEIEELRQRLKIPDFETERRKLWNTLQRTNFRKR
jgi:hypothetical protein